jgi:hypothetical protein
MTAERLHANVKRTVLTMTHSTRMIDEFIALLQQVDVNPAAGIRSIPRPRAVARLNVVDAALRRKP